MQTYKVQHLPDGQIFERPAVLTNPLYDKSRNWPSFSSSEAEAFHKTLPDYNQTRLHDLSSAANELGIGKVFVKDESDRFGLPAFKVLGASWAVHKAICQRLNIPAEGTSFTELSETLKNHGPDRIQLVTCTAGNWGRAVARMAKYLSIPARVYVPSYTSEHTKNMISHEGAELKVDSGKTYEDALAAAQRDAADAAALLVQDVSWKGYEEIPAWTVEGYGTMLLEADRQVMEATGKRPTLVIAALGGGLWAQAVTAYYKGIDPTTVGVTVEADTATGFKESLHCGQNTVVQTGVTIMEGMNSGATLESAWRVLRAGADVAVAVTDREAHESVRYLQERGINAGPCGGATLAALRKLSDANILQDPAGITAVLFSTEGNRDYQIPA